MGPVSWRHSLLVFHLQVSSLVYQEFTHLEATQLDGIVEWPLILGVHDVEVGPQVNQLLYCLCVTFADRVVYRRLTVLVLLIEIFYAPRDKVIDHSLVAFPRSIEDWRLLQSILFEWVDAHLD